MKKICLIICLSVFIAILGYIVGNIFPLPQNRIIQIEYVEVPVEVEKIVKEYVEICVPVEKETIIYNYDSLLQPVGRVDGEEFYNTYVGEYEVYYKYYGPCDIENETIFFSTDTHYWVERFTGCEAVDEYSDYYYLLINRSYIPLSIAIKDGYVTEEDFEKTDLGSKIGIVND